MPAHTYNLFSRVVVAATLRIEKYKRTDSEKFLKMPGMGLRCSSAI
jgi:hypothetical protein